MEQPLADDAERVDVASRAGLLAAARSFETGQHLPVDELAELLPCQAGGGQGVAVVEALDLPAGDDTHTPDVGKDGPLVPVQARAGHLLPGRG